MCQTDRNFIEIQYSNSKIDGHAQMLSMPRYANLSTHTQSHGLG